MLARCLAAAARAGVQRRDWVRAHGVDGRSLNCWYRSLRGPNERLKPRTRPAPLLELAPKPEPDEMPQSGAGVFVVRVHGLEIEVPADFDEEERVRLIEAVRQC